jgi:predicted GNAT family N-acyltransferase
VDNALHKKGIGRELLLYRIQLIRSGFPGYPISLDTTQHSYLFFEKMGFKVVKITRDGYGEGLDRYDMVSE